jgi:hypothetical protein
MRCKARERPVSWAGGLPKPVTSARFFVGGFTLRFPFRNTFGVRGPDTRAGARSMLGPRASIIRSRASSCGSTIERSSGDREHCISVSQNASTSGGVRPWARRIGEIAHCMATSTHASPAQVMGCSHPKGQARAPICGSQLRPRTLASAAEGRGRPRHQNRTPSAGPTWKPVPPL